MQEESVQVLGLTAQLLVLEPFEFQVRFARLLVPALPEPPPAVALLAPQAE